MSDIERRQAFLQRCARHLCDFLGVKVSETDGITEIQEELEDSFECDPDNHYYIAKDKSSPVLLTSWLCNNRSDPAIKVSAPYLLVNNVMMRCLLGIPRTTRRSSNQSLAI